MGAYDKEITVALEQVARAMVAIAKAVQQIADNTVQLDVEIVKSVDKPLRDEWDE